MLTRGRELLHANHWLECHEIVEKGLNRTDMRLPLHFVTTVGYFLRLCWFLK